MNRADGRPAATVRVPRRPWLPHDPVAALATLVLLAACGGGGGPSGVGPGPDDRAPREFSATSLAAVDRELEPAERRHFLDRTGFGASAGELAELERSGLANAVESMLIYQREQSVVTRALAEIRDVDHPQGSEVGAYWLSLMLNTRQPFREALALFWHDVFAVSHRKLDAAGKHLMLRHVELLRTRPVGNLRDLLLAVLTDPATLVWLDAVDSTREAPNENLAREFWELLALGKDNGYTERDIEEAARALTGYRLGYDEQLAQTTVEFDPARHDPDPKTIFGQTGRFDARALVDLTVARRPVAEHVCRGLFEWLCYPDAPDALVADLAKGLRDDGYELRPLLRRILLSEAFHSTRSRDARRVKTPIELVVGFVRVTGMQVPIPELREALGELGQVPTQPSNIGGWPQDTAWLSGEAMLERGNAITLAIAAREHQHRIGYDVADLLPPDADADTTVAALADRLGVELSDAEHARLSGYLDSRAEFAADRLVIEPSPFDPMLMIHREERVRGLLYILAQHPDYQLR